MAGRNRNASVGDTAEAAAQEEAVAALKTAELRRIPIEELKPAEYNPRKKLGPKDAEYKKIKNSIQEFGFVDPVVVNADMTVIGGHQRLTVAKELGFTELPCAVVDVDKTREKALNVALNKITGAWDMALLSGVFADLAAVGYDMELTGFDKDSIAAFLNDGSAEATEDGFDVDAELKNPTFSKEGDVWHLGRHRVICGDSTMPETYGKLMDGVKANLVCTDPPYLVNLESASGKIKNDDLDDKEGYEFLRSAFERFHEAMADDASIYVFYATAKARVFHDAYEDAGFKVGAGLVWKKDRLVLTRTDWKYIHEPIIWGWRKDGKHIWYGDQKQVTVFDFDRIKNSKEDGCGHPSSKPVPLIAYLIKQCTMTNGIVLDGFLGSASTLIACEQLDRECRGVELEPKFVDVAVQRYRKHCMDNGKSTDDVYVMRGGQKLTFEEAVAVMDDGPDADDGAPVNGAAAPDDVTEMDE